MTDPAPPVTGGAKAMKAVWQLLAAMALAALPLITDGPHTPNDWVNAGLAALGAGTVYIAANLPGTVWEYTKTFMSAVAAGGIILNSALTDFTVTHTEWYQIGTAILGVLLVYLVPNDTVIPGRHRADPATP